MTSLIIYRDSDPSAPVASYTDWENVAAALSKVSVRFERWEAAVDLPDDADDRAVLAAYARSIEMFQATEGFQSFDVVRIPHGAPDTAPLRAKFLQEHTHSEDEARFFIEGAGAFYLHIGDKVYRIICERDDLLSVPAGTRHWFDMGPQPFFTAIRFFTRPDGWVAEYTGDAIADRFPKYE